MRLHTKRSVEAVFGGLIVVGLVLGLTAPAQAHNYLVSSTPAANSTLTELPEEFVITTNDQLLALDGAGNGFALQVVDGDGLYYGDGCVDVAGPSMTSAAALGPAGTYTVSWQVVSADGHAVSDAYTFTWAPVTDAEISEGSTSAPVCDGTGSAAEDSGSNDAGQNAVSSPMSGDLYWIGGALVAAAAAAGATLLLVRRRRHR